ncbi:MAG: diguanylate cyclase [Deltaproteobacteria bacterium]|nr:diguanylate cyclase [Deltaproteobacteria bacterium]
MKSHRYSIRLFRPRLGIGLKTWLGMSLIFWTTAPLILGTSYYLFRTEAESRVLDGLRAGLEQTQGELGRAGDRLAAALTAQAGAVAHLSAGQAAPWSSWGEGFRRDFPWVAGWLALDAGGRVLGAAPPGVESPRGWATLGRAALRQGRPQSGLTLWARDPARAAGRESLAVLAAAPVLLDHQARVVLLAVAPLEAGFLAERIALPGREVALLAGSQAGEARVQTASPSPRDIFPQDGELPGALARELALGRPVAGEFAAEGLSLLAAVRELRGPGGGVVGYVAAAQATRGLAWEVFRPLAWGLAVAAVVGLVLTGLLTYYIYSDIVQPLNYLSRAMGEVGQGQLDVEASFVTGDQFEELAQGFNDMVAGIRARENKLSKHHEVANLLISTLNLRELVDRLLQIVTAFTRSEIGIVYLSDQDTGVLTPCFHLGVKGDLQPLAPGEGFPGRAASDRTTIVVSPPHDAEQEMVELGFARLAPREAAYIPLGHQDRLLGVLVLGTLDRYAPEDHELFTYLAGQLAVALDNALLHQKVRELSNTDALTGLFNRRHLHERLEEMLSRARRHGLPLTVLLFDLDNFKLVNDTYGHERGDEVLKLTAATLRTNLRREDVASRYGGEEFVVALDNTTPAGGVAYAQRVAGLLREARPGWLQGNITVSVGVAGFPAHEFGSCEAFVDAADQAMYRAKTAGKDQICLYQT